MYNRVYPWMKSFLRWIVAARKEHWSVKRQSREKWFCEMSLKRWKRHDGNAPILPGDEEVSSELNTDRIAPRIASRLSGRESVEFERIDSRRCYEWCKLKGRLLRWENNAENAGKDAIKTALIDRHEYSLPGQARGINIFRKLAFFYEITFNSCSGKRFPWFFLSFPFETMGTEWKSVQERRIYSTESNDTIVSSNWLEFL